jgi:hydrogenase 3 maturation protease
MVARELRSFAHESLLVIEAEHAPENHTGRVRQFKPTLVLLVDAAQMNEPPGMIRWLAVEQLTGMSASTHTMPPYMLTRFLQAELGCEVALIGIQPADTTLGAPLSEEVKTAVATIVQTIRGLEMRD